MNYHLNNSNKYTVRAYGRVLDKFCRQFDDKKLKLVLQEPKIGREGEMVFAPRKVSERLKNPVCSR